ncbi:steroid 5-alpha-reductase DET2 [Phoenix dactylifera]|uniref:3-oxo-5alpha-steroid 4-dehydrogenase (NADP(+)) n=1 Tax=Phoenix dactylifera TaxID=42345 RepID=A0A8B9ACT1_PHODC|nr:steroid 5-alpha-reductase DET2 [Phoenix dactylifera]
MAIFNQSTKSRTRSRHPMDGRRRGSTCEDSRPSSAILKAIRVPKPSSLFSGGQGEEEVERRMESSLSDETLFGTALVTLYVMCPLTVLSLRFLAAPYGRHARSGWGPALPAALAWALMESPTLWLTLLLLPRGRHRSHPLALTILALYLLHYIHRTVVYPLRLSIKSKSKSGFPLVIALVAFSFNLLNAYLQARSASHYAEYPAASSAFAFGLWVWLRVLVGMGIFFWGMSVNIRSDLALLRLKAEGGGYRIPRGGWFEWVSCPNYMGEAAEWLGWAVVACSPAALAFFLYTCSNLVPRARAHHQWYLEKFGEDYPRSRKAVVPFVY